MNRAGQRLYLESRASGNGQDTEMAIFELRVGAVLLLHTLSWAPGG